MDRKAKITSLTNYEQSHVFGLKFLSYLICDLDVLLLIESQYDASHLLLNLQNSNRVNNLDMSCLNEDDEISKEDESNDTEPTQKQPDIIIDMLSVERNFVLVNANLIGGPSEKILPARSLAENVISFRTLLSGF